MIATSQYAISFQATSQSVIASGEAVYEQNVPISQQIEHHKIARK